jgi:nucleotide-binding universal stress UspA family protein
MQREILVPLDGSTLAEMALPHAMALARAEDCSLDLLRVLLPAELLHTWSPDVPLETVKQWVVRSRDTAQIYLARLSGRMQGQGLRVRYEVVVEEDAALGIVAMAAQDPSTTMIVMATHGRTGVARWVFGSVTDKVLHATTTPLLLVRPTSDGAPVLEPATYTSILVPLDGSMFADQALRKAQKLAADTNATLLLITVTPPVSGLEPEIGVQSGNAAGRDAEMVRVVGYLKQKAQQLEGEGVRVRVITAQGQPAEEILRVAVEEHADLIVMSTHGVGGVRQFRMGGVASKVVQGATLPVLLLRGWERQPHAPEE